MYALNLKLLAINIAHYSNYKSTIYTGARNAASTAKEI
jgi:hypothetical protein